MLRFELLPGRNILVVIPEGPLEQADFEQFARQVDPLIASAGSIAAGLMIEARSFPGWRNFGAYKVGEVPWPGDRQIDRTLAAAGK
jgi:hypothetical protein